MTAIENVILFATNSHPDIYLLEMSTIGNDLISLYAIRLGIYLLEMTTIENIVLG